MFNFLPAGLVGIIATTLLVLNILLCATFLFPFSFLKFLLPFPPATRLLDKFLLRFSTDWISRNVAWMTLTQKTTWDVKGLEQLNPQGWYLVVSNHQAWADILVLQKLLNRRIPFIKFFLKRELIWVPIMGLAWWALDFPFLRRHNADYLKKHPEQRGKDFETTRKACEKFSQTPATVMNFLEGTRFTAGKHKQQNSPYQYLLKPKAGGIALALGVLGDKFHLLLNATIVYPDGIPTFWDFLCGRVKKIIVRFEPIEIPKQYLHRDYEADKDFQTEFQQWVQDLWKNKDQQIAALLKEEKAP